MNQKLRLALPKGSLNNPERGNTDEQLKLAGFNIAGYEPGKERKPAILNDSELEVRLDRPQDMPLMMQRGFYDAAIFGLDTFYETGEIAVPVCDLKYGKVTIVAGVRDELTVREGLPTPPLVETLEDLLTMWSLRMRPDKPLVCATEYPRIAKKWIVETAKDPSGQWGGTEKLRETLRKETRIFEDPYAQADCTVAVYTSRGMTEWKCRYGFADMVVEASQTGNGFREANLKQLGIVMESSAGLFAAEDARNDPWKREKIEFLALKLMSATRAREYFMVAMNVPETRLNEVVNYLTENRLCGKTPTVSIYGGNAAVETMLPRDKYPSAIDDLLRLGADDIVNRTTGAVVKREIIKWGLE